jgi:glucose dehydrogenase
MWPKSTWQNKTHGESLEKLTTKQGTQQNIKKTHGNEFAVRKGPFTVCFGHKAKSGFPVGKKGQISIFLFVYVYPC